MQHVSTVLTAALVVMTFFLFVFGAASMISIVKGYTELRKLFRSASANFDAVLLKSPTAPGVSMVTAPPDHSPASLTRVRHLLDLHYGRHDLVVVLDGPSDEALAVWTREYRLAPYPRTAGGELPCAPIRGFYRSLDPLKMLVVVKDPGGTHDALNAGVNAAGFPVLGFVDDEADFIPEWPLRLIRPMLSDWSHTVAVCGVSLPPGPDTLVGRIGALGDLRRWMVRCAAFSAWKKMVPVPGACMLVKRSAVVEAGGFPAGQVGLFLVLYAAAKTRSTGQRVAFVPTAVSWSRAASTLAELRELTEYDQRQLSAGMKHGGAGVGRKFNAPFYLREARPLVETATLVLALIGAISGLVHPALLGLALIASAGVGMAVSMTAIVLRELADPGVRQPLYLARLFLATIPENLGFRQMRNLWQIAGMFR